MVLKIPVVTFWVMTPFSLIGGYQRFRKTSFFRADDYTLS
jgi:hypothetical protein